MFQKVRINVIFRVAFEKRKVVFIYLFYVRAYISLGS